MENAPLKKVVNVGVWGRKKHERRGRPQKGLSNLVKVAELHAKCPPALSDGT